MVGYHGVQHDFDGGGVNSGTGGRMVMGVLLGSPCHTGSVLICNCRINRIELLVDDWVDGGDFGTGRRYGSVGLELQGSGSVD